MESEATRIVVCQLFLPPTVLVHSLLSTRDSHPSPNVPKVLCMFVYSTTLWNGGFQLVLVVFSYKRRSKCPLRSPEWYRWSGSFVFGFTGLLNNPCTPFSHPISVKGASQTTNQEVWYNREENLYRDEIPNFLEPLNSTTRTINSYKGKET